jgi:predicted nucleic acid-binding protein
MIVVDTNVIASLVLPTSGATEAAVRALEHDRDWAAPTLWRSELCNILATGIRNGWMDLSQALEALATAEEVMDGGEFTVPAAEVVKLAADSGCTGYDSEFVLLALQLSARLVTLDRGILEAFPEVAVPLEELAAERPS